MSSPLKRELDGVLRPQKIPGLQAGEDVNAGPFRSTMAIPASRLGVIDLNDIERP